MSVPGSSAVLPTELYRPLLDSMPDAVVLVGEQGTIELANARAETMFGYGCGELGGAPIDQLVPERLRRQHQGHRKGFFGAPVTRALGSRGKLRGLRKDNTEFAIEISLAPVRTPTGLLVSAAIRDVSDQVGNRLKSEFAELRRALQALDATCDGIFQFDPVSLRFVQVNQGAASQTGYRRDELLAMTPLDLKPEYNEEQYRRMLEPLISGTAASQTLTTAHRRKDGTRVPVEVVIQWIGRAPDDQIMVAVARDITERKSAEQVLVARTQRIEAQAAALLAVSRSSAFSTGDIEQLARELTEKAAAVAGVERANVWLFNEPETELHCIDLFESTPARHSAGSILREHEFRDEFRALKAAHYIDADHAMTDPRTRGYLKTYLEPLHIMSMLDAVVRVSARNVGILCLEHVDREHHWQQDEISFACAMADKVGLALGIREVLQARRTLEDNLEETVRAFASTVEARDPYTAGHQSRVAVLAVAIAREVGLSVPQVRGLELASMIHDIGKLQVPADILNKPGRLTKIEHQLVQQHAQAGYDILKGVHFPWPIAEIVLQHHERLDGSGYPRGLNAAQILPEAGILAVADVVESMASHRPYRAALGIDVALAQILKDRGVTLDSDAVDACVKLFREQAFVLPGVWAETKATVPPARNGAS